MTILMEIRKIQTHVRLMDGLVVRALAKGILLVLYLKFEVQMKQK